MRTVEEVRRLRLLELQSEEGSWVALNSRVELTTRDSTLSQIANRSVGSKTGKPKTMGSDLARKLEAACGKPEGWMDTDPELDAQRWPFGDMVDIRQVHALDEQKLQEAARFLNFIMKPTDEPGVGVTAGGQRYFKPPPLPGADGSGGPTPTPSGPPPNRKSRAPT